MLETTLHPLVADTKLRKQTFTINDIDLVIPPSAISVQKEDLTYTWRTLRTNSATKLPTGHGAISVGLQLVFLNDRLSDMHRLILQLRQSPFCYIENRYLRETIVPQWTLSKNMAFAMDAMQVAPLAGATNAWVMQLRLSWFNYAPFAPNFLFREEWETEWLEGVDRNGDIVSVRQSIGWDWDQSGNRVFKPTITEVGDAGLNRHGTYSQIVDDLKGSSERTIFGLEALHLGQEFDLLPLPGNMKPSQMTLFPKNSRIYTRYINLLQRDALRRNFGIDVTDLLEKAGLPAEAFFGVLTVAGGGKETWGLHTGPTLDAFRPQYHQFIRDLHQQMLRSNNQVNFAFQTYKQVKFPPEWSTALRDLSKDIRDGYRGETEDDQWLTLYRYDKGGVSEPWKRIAYRKGFGSPNGFRSPVGFDSTTRASFSELQRMVTTGKAGPETVRVRTPSFDKRTYGRSRNTDRVHNGIDLADHLGRVGTNSLRVFACRPGKVISIGDGSTKHNLTWKYYDKITQKRGKVGSNPVYYEDWLASAQRFFGEDAVLLDKGTPRFTKAYAKHEHAGRWFESIGMNNTFYYLDRGDGGNYVSIRHENGDISSYLHLSDIYVNYGVTIAEGGEWDIDKPIGRVGQSSTFSPEFLRWALGRQQATQGFLDPYDVDWLQDESNKRAYNQQTGEAIDRHDNNKGGFSVGGHLHFEYWEREEFGPPVDMSPDGNPGDKDWAKQSRKGYLPVEMMHSWAMAKDQDSWVLEVAPNKFHDVDATADRIREELEENLGEKYEIDEDQVFSLAEAIDTLTSQGWYHFEGEHEFPNIWYKTWMLGFTHSDLTDVDNPNLYVSQNNNVVVTGASASLHNILAKLPILGHEYPSMQHMGSTEPSYNFEFTAIDDLPNLEGIPRGASLVEGMRSVLQSNARKYRNIKDSWAVATDTFLTRLFGSYRDDDAEYTSDGEAIQDVRLLRRTMISRAENGTVEGNPGLSYIHFEMSETNPYYDDKLVNTNSAFVDVEKAREEVLQALYALEFADEYKGVALPFLVGNLASSSFIDPSSDGYGQFELTQLNDSQVLNPFGELDEKRVVFLSPEQAQKYLGINSKDAIAIYDPSGSYERLLAGGVYDAGGNYALQRLQDHDDILFVTQDGGGKDYAPSELSQLSDYSTGTARTQDFGKYKTGAIAGDRHGGRTFGKVGPTTIVRRSYDVRKLIRDSGDASLFAKINLAKIADYWLLIDSTIDSAGVLLAEHPDLIATLKDRSVYGHGMLTEEKIQEELYGLPVHPRMWRQFQLYHAAVAQTFARWPDLSSKLNGLLFNDSPSKKAAAETLLRNNPGWIEWQEGINIEDARQLDGGLFRSEAMWRVAAGVAYDSLFDWLTSLGMEFVGDQFVSTTELVFDRDIFGESTQGLTGSQIGDYAIRSQLETVEQRIVDLYFNSYVSIRHEYLRQIIKFHARESLFGPLIGSVEGVDSDTASPIATPYGQLYDHVHSSGYWGFGMGDDVVEQAIGSGFPAFILPPSEGVIESESRSTDYIDSSIKANGPKTFGRMTLWGALVWKSEGQIITGIEEWGSPLRYDVTKEQELEKVRYFKAILAGLADDILNDYQMLSAFGLQEYAYVLANQQRVTGSEAYPDLDLPEHPYYGTHFQTTPDFYFWNIYEDGQAFSEDVLNDAKEAAYSVVEECYNSMRRMQDGEKYSPSTTSDGYLNYAVMDPSTVELPLRYNAEATDGNTSNPVHKGHMGVPFYPAGASEPAIAEFEGRGRDVNDSAKMAVSAVSSSSIIALDVDQSEILKLNPPSARMDVLEGGLGAGGGLLYPTRVQQSVYEELEKRLKSTESMFGSRAGYLKKNHPDEFDEDTYARLKGTEAERPDEFAHLFDPASLKSIANDASKDILSHRMTMRRAFPTFKLFIVEEDEVENALLSYDDFYSYNGVKSFTFVDSRKNAASTAIVTLQNISGTLDGTRRDALTDLDYFGKNIDKKLDGYESSTEDDPIADSTDAEQPFDSVVLRPGVNVQLRAGFSNDPKNLTVLISGRVVDLTWNKTGDLAEIVIQSFGAELVQAIKGSSRGSGEESTYQTTHHLLGALMLEPELVHFGRWEHGQIYQLGESQDARLDFRDYTREGNFGRFKSTIGITEWLFDSPKFLLAAGIGVTALGFFSGGGRFATRVAGSAKPGFLRRAFAALSAKNFRGVADDALGTAVNAATSNLGNVGRAARVVNVGRAGYWDKIIRNTVGDALEVGGWKALSDRNKAKALVRILDEFKVLKRNLKELGHIGEDSWRILDKEFLDTTKLLREAETVEEVASLVSSFGSRIRTLVFSDQWANKGVVELMESPLEFVSGKTLKRLGGNLFTAYTAGQSKVLLTGTLLGLTADLIYREPMEWLWEATVGRLSRFFDTSKVSMFLNPQDDNIYPPHPKDYMDLREVTWWDAGKKLLIKQGASIITTSDELGYLALRWFDSPELFDKRVQPRACQYRLLSTTIWDVFHEMTLRHPGWVYGARPYGTAFRYTMFFGIPSQRYWAGPASNEFARRANKLARFLENREISESEYLDLYGNNLNGMTLEKAKEQLTQSLRRGDPVIKDTDGLTVAAREGESNASVGDDAAFEAIWKQKLTAPAVLEYLRALEIRFRPFRKNHLVSSNTDLIWNGLLNSENAMYNAVNVSFFQEGENDYSVVAEGMGSQTFKAHSFIPQHMIRVMSLPTYRNCKGNAMAARYGMGALLHSMRDMYRGEIITVGNPRIRPWDYCILTDDYNDMVGPIEVEQVVHNFSHETGFITEIKPSAVVIGNEISSWPVLEAAKIFSLAVRDIERNYWSQGANIGGFEDFLKFANYGMAADDRRILQEKYEAMFGGDFKIIQNLDNDQELLESLEVWDEQIENVVSKVRGYSAGALGFAGGAAGLLAGGLLFAGVRGTKFVMSIPDWGVGLGVGGSVALGGIAGGAAGGVLSGYIGETILNPPSLKMLLGGSVLFLQCMREEAIMVVPLMKGGKPIVSGLALQDPSMMWSHFRGNLQRVVRDTFEGTEDLLQTWSKYSTGSWRAITDAWELSSDRDQLGLSRETMTGERG